MWMRRKYATPGGDPQDCIATAATCCHNKQNGSGININCVSFKIISTFSDKPAPTRHIWIVGDELLDSMANVLRKLVNQHIFDVSKPELYIHQECHVEAFNDSEIKYTFNNIMRKVRNNLTLALNKFPAVLPEFLIIMLGNSYIHDQVFVEMEFRPILKRVLNDVSRLLTGRKEQLPPKVLNLRGTQVYMTRPLPKPATALKGDQKFKNTRRYLNQMMDRLSLTCEFKPLNIDAVNCSQRILFEKNGSLSDYGKERMWQSISDFIKTKDSQLQLAIQRSCVTKEDAGTQVKSEHYQSDLQAVATQGEVVDKYFTAANLRDSWTDSQTNWQSEQPQRQQEWMGYSRCDFDDYHRRYDREDYYPRNDRRDQY